MRRRRKRDFDETDAERIEEAAAADFSGFKVHEALTSVTAQIVEITEAAERSATETRAKAEAEAKTLIERRGREADEAAAAIKAAAAEAADGTRIAVNQVGAAVTDLRQRLIQAAEELAKASAQMAKASTALEASTVSNAPPPSAGERTVPEAPGGSPVPSAGERTVPEAPGRSPVPDRAEGAWAPSEADSHEAGLRRAPLVRASQMAMAGTSREEIGQALRREFGVTDPKPILDEALGNE